MTAPATHADLRAAHTPEPSRAMGAFGFAVYVREALDISDPQDIEMIAKKFEALGAEIERLNAALALPGDEVRLRVRWEGDALMVGNVKLGSVWPSRIHDNKWAYRHFPNGPTRWADTRDAAREALVKAVGGEG